MAKTKLYKEKPKKKSAQKYDNNGLAIVPNSTKKVDKKAAHNTKLLGQMDISWSE